MDSCGQFWPGWLTSCMLQIAEFLESLPAEAAGPSDWNHRLDALNEAIVVPTQVQPCLIFVAVCMLQIAYIANYSLSHYRQRQLAHQTGITG